MRTPTTDRWRYRREPRPYHPEDVGFSALAAGIVAQAVEDYRYAARKYRLAAHIEDKTARAAAMSRHRNTMSEITVFFRGSWYGLLCDIDPERIIRKLEKEAKI